MPGTYDAYAPALGCLKLTAVLQVFDFVIVGISLFESLFLGLVDVIVVDSSVARIFRIFRVLRFFRLAGCVRPRLESCDRFVSASSSRCRVFKSLNQLITAFAESIIGTLWVGVLVMDRLIDCSPD